MKMTPQDGSLSQHLARQTRALLASEARLRRVLDGSSEGYWEWHLASGTLFLSPRCREILGIPPGDGPTLKQLMRLVHPDDFSRVMRAYRAVMAPDPGLDHLDVEYRIVRPDRSTAWLQVRAGVNRRNGTGRTHRLAGMMADVTERKAAEQERRLLERQLVKACDTERQRIGRDLHDSLGQVLTGLALNAHALASQLAAGGDESAGRQAMELAAHLRTAVVQARELAAALCPVQLEGDGLHEGLRQLAKSTRDLFDVDCSTALGSSLPHLDENTAMHLYRIAQEAVHNAVRHGKGAAIEIGLTHQDGTLELSVRDDGAGFELLPPGQNGIGLASMQHRAEELGAALRIDSRPGHGTTVVCRLPA
jgi:PAS domain S-box-containing protein